MLARYRLGYIAAGPLADNGVQGATEGGTGMIVLIAGKRRRTRLGLTELYDAADSFLSVWDKVQLKNTPSLRNLHSVVRVRQTTDDDAFGSDTSS